MAQTTFDMSPLDAEHRIQIFIVVDNSDKLPVVVHDDANIAEVRLEISKTLNIPIEEQKELKCILNDNEETEIELTAEDEKANKHINDYDPPISDKAVFNLQVSQSFNKNQIKTNNKAPKVVAPRNPNEEQKQTTRQSQPRPKPTPTQIAPAPNRNGNNDNSRNKNVRNQRVYEPNDEGRQLVSSICKASKIHCILLLVLMQVQLVLIVLNWQDLDVLMYAITIFFGLLGWYGCRTLHPIFILGFLLYLTLEMILLLLFVIVGIVEQHESIYDSVAAYIALLIFELIIYVIWSVYYLRFFRSVSSLDIQLRAWASQENRKQAVFC